MLVGSTVCGYGYWYCTGPGTCSLLSPSCHSDSRSKASVVEPDTALSNPSTPISELFASSASRKTYPKFTWGESAPNLAEAIANPRPEKAPEPRRFSWSPVGKRPSRRTEAPNELLCVRLIFRRAATSPIPVAEPSISDTAVITGAESVPAKRYGEGNPAGWMVATLVPCTEVWTRGTATDRSTPSTRP